MLKQNMPRSFLVKKQKIPKEQEGKILISSKNMAIESEEEVMDNIEEIDVVGDDIDVSFNSEDEDDCRKQPGDENVFVEDKEKRMSVSINDSTGDHATRKFSGVKADEYNNDNNQRSLCQRGKQTSPQGGVAMIAAKRRTPEPAKTSPSIAPDFRALMKQRSISPPLYSAKQHHFHQAEVTSGGFNPLGVNRFSDPKFWQNTLPTITHHYTSPFNFHRLPHAITATNNQHSPPPVSCYPPCFPLSPISAAVPNFPLPPSSFFRPPPLENNGLLTIPSPPTRGKYHPNERPVPYAFVQPSASSMISPRLEASLSIPSVHSKTVDSGSGNDYKHHKRDIRHMPYGRITDKRAVSPLKLKEQVSPTVESNNHPHSHLTTGPLTSPAAKTLTWLHELPYNTTETQRQDNVAANRRINEPPRYQCDACKKSYATFSGLSKHKQFHCESHVKKEFSCKFCDKTYNSLGALKMHIRTHTLPCKCQICGKAFSRPWLLQGHMRTHTGEKPFVCSQCGRAFADRSNLRAHLQTHSDVKKYSCQDCTKTFSRMSLLVKHKESSCPGIRNTALQNMITATV